MSKSFSLPGIRLGWLASKNTDFIDIGRERNLSNSFSLFFVKEIKEWSLVLSELTHLMHKFQYKFGELTSHQTPFLRFLIFFQSINPFS
jgi:hypothetical protein